MRRIFALFGIAATLGISGVASAARDVPGALPRLDEGDVALHALRIPGTSLTQANEMQHALERRLEKFPEEKIVFAKQKGIDVIICDHHNPDEIPPAYAVLDPKRPDCAYPY